MGLTGPELLVRSDISSHEGPPGLGGLSAPAVSSSALLRRPEMMTLLPFACSASARPRPIPEPPPVMKIVLPVSFMLASQKL